MFCQSSDPPKFVCYLQKCFFYNSETAATTATTASVAFQEKLTCKYKVASLEVLD